MFSALVAALANVAAVLHVCYVLGDSFSITVMLENSLKITDNSLEVRSGKQVFRCTSSYSLAYPKTCLDNSRKEEW